MNVKIDMKIYRILPPFKKLEYIYKNLALALGALSSALSIVPNAKYLAHLAHQPSLFMSHQMF